MEINKPTMKTENIRKSARTNLGENIQKSVQTNLGNNIKTEIVRDWSWIFFHAQKPNKLQLAYFLTVGREIAKTKHFF